MSLQMATRDNNVTLSWVSTWVCRVCTHFAYCHQYYLQTVEYAEKTQNITDNCWYQCVFLRSTLVEIRECDVVMVGTLQFEIREIWKNWSTFIFLLSFIKFAIMLKKPNYQIVSTWIQFTSNIQKRKYYSSIQLYDLFKLDTRIAPSLVNIITKRAFVRHLNTYVDACPLFYKIQQGYPTKPSIS